MAFLNTPGQLKQLPTGTPNQQNIINQSGNNALNLLKQIQGNQFNFEPIAQQARTQFNTQTVPSIAERFTSMGTGGSQGSSAFRGALGSAGSGLEQSLAALQSQYGLQQRDQDIGLLGQLLNTGLQPTFSNYYQPGEQGWGTGALSALGLGLGSAVPGLVSGGSSLLSNLLSLLSGGSQQQSQQQGFQLGGNSGMGFSNPSLYGQNFAGQNGMPIGGYGNNNLKALFGGS